MWRRQNCSRSLQVFRGMVVSVEETLQANRRGENAFHRTDTNEPRPSRVPFSGLMYQYGETVINITREDGP
jgi:hypothetical protein